MTSAVPRSAFVETRTVARKSAIGGLYVCAGGFDIGNSMKTPLIYSVSYFNFVGFGALLGGLSPTKPLRCDGTGCKQNRKIIPKYKFVIEKLSGNPGKKCLFHAGTHPLRENFHC